MNDVYTNETDQPEAAPLAGMSCPVCDHRPLQLWRYASEPDEPLQFVVTCGRDPDAEGGALGREGLNAGCLLHMPPGDFYQPTRRAAIAYFRRVAEAVRAAWE